MEPKVYSYTKEMDVNYLGQERGHPKAALNTNDQWPSFLVAPVQASHQLGLSLSVNALRTTARAQHTCSWIEVVF